MSGVLSRIVRDSAFVTSNGRMTVYEGPIVPPEPPTENYFQVRNVGSGAASFRLYSATPGNIFVNGEYYGSFKRAQETAIEITVGGVATFSGLSPSGSISTPMFIDGTTVSQLSIERFDESLSNYCGAFYGFESLKDVTTHDGLEKVTNATSMFHGCTNLTSDIETILYNYLDTKTIEVSQHADCFTGCTVAIGWANIPQSWGGGLSYNPLGLPSYTIRLKMSSSSVDPTSWRGTWTKVSGTDDTWDCTYQNPDWSYLFASKRDIVEVLGANTSSVTNMLQLFMEAINIRSIALFDTSNVTNLWGFLCEQNHNNVLTSVPKFDTSKATDMGWFLRGCTALTSIPCFNTRNCTNFEYFVGECTSLSTVPVLDTSKAINMGFMFDATPITECPLLDTSNVTSMFAMFQSCRKLTKVPLFNTSKVTNMRAMFNNCSSLSNVPLFDTSNVTDMQWMFASGDWDDPSPVLTTVPLFNTSKVTNMEKMFAGKRALLSVPEFDTSKVTNFKNMFRYCENLTSVPHFDTSSATDMSYMFYYCKKLGSIPLFDTSNVTNMEYAFYNCNSLTSVPLLDTSKVTTMNNTFYNCYGITSIPWFDFSSLENMSTTFYSCIGLTSIPLFNTSKVTNMSYAFTSCTNIASFPLFDTSNVTNMSSTFAYCRGVTTLPNYNTSKVTNMNNTFYSIYIRNLPQIDTSNVTDMRGICGWCRYLREIPLLNTSKVTRFSNAFMNCYSVSSGALALYNQISSQTTPPTDHSQSFADCGRDTTAGSAELAQIPSDWK